MIGLFISIFLIIEPHSSQISEETRPPAPVLFDDEPSGFSVILPKNSNVEDFYRTGPFRGFMIRESGDSPSWHMRVVHFTSGQRELFERDISLLIAAAQEDPLRKTLRDDIWAFQRMTGRYVAIEQPAADGKIVTGWLIGPEEPDGRTVISLVVNAKKWELMEPILLASAATVARRPEALVDRTREETFQKGVEFLKKITPEDLKKLTHNEKWFRLTRTNPPINSTKKNSRKTTKEDFGWAKIEIIEGPMGLVSGRKKPENWSKTEQETGLLIIAKSRRILDRQKKTYLNEEGRFWLALDLEEEFWSTSSSLEQGPLKRTEIETGIRGRRSIGKSNSILHVSKIETYTNKNDAFQWPVPKAYLPQALTWIIGPLLHVSKAEGRTYRWHCYDASTGLPQLLPRTDLWKRTPSGWVLKSQAFDDRPFTEMHFDNFGALIKQVIDTNTTLLPSSYESIRKIWMQEGLTFGN